MNLAKDHSGFFNFHPLKGTFRKRTKMGTKIYTMHYRQQKTRLPSDKKHSRGKEGDSCCLKTEKELGRPHRMLFV